jgi:hypothetical protein
MPILLSNLFVAPTKENQFIRCAPEPRFALVGLLTHFVGYFATVAPIFAEVFEDGGLGYDLRDTPMIASRLGRALIRTPRVFSRMAELHVSDGRVVTGIQTSTRRHVEAIRLEETPWDGSLRIAEANWTPWLGVASKAGALSRHHEGPRWRGVAVGIVATAELFLSHVTLVTAELLQIGA